MSDPHPVDELDPGEFERPEGGDSDMSEFVIYDVTVTIDKRDAPGMQPIVDALYDGLIALGAREGYVEVEVKGPPELRIEVTMGER